MTTLLLLVVAIVVIVLAVRLRQRRRRRRAKIVKLMAFIVLATAFFCIVKYAASAVSATARTESEADHRNPASCS